jgi:hypothetical protein
VTNETNRDLCPTSVHYFHLVLSGCANPVENPATGPLISTIRDAQSSPNQSSASNKIVSAAEAETFTSNEFVPLEDFVVFIPCANGDAGENVTLNGLLHIQLHITINGNSILIKEHFQPQGVDGFGEITGEKYQGTGVSQDVSRSDFNGFPFEFNLTDSFKIIGQGPGNNFLVQETFHVAINANGEVTVEHDNLFVDCK